MEEQDLSRLTECKGYVAEAEGSQMSVVGGVQWGKDLQMPLSLAKRSLSGVAVGWGMNGKWSCRNQENKSLRCFHREMGEKEYVTAKEGVGLILVFFKIEETLHCI